MSDLETRLQQLKCGRCDVVVDLLERGVDVGTRDRDGVSMLEWCAYHGDVAAVRHLERAGAALADLGRDLGLRGAAFHGHWQLAQYALERGAPVDDPDDATGETALHLALCKAGRPGFSHVVEVLLMYGANPNRATAPGIETACFMRDARTRHETALHRAAAFGDERCIDLLLLAGADLRARDMNGDTPLAWASWHLRPPSVLRRLCFDHHAIHPDNASTYDHGAGHSLLDPWMRARPLSSGPRRG